MTNLQEIKNEANGNWNSTKEAPVEFDPLNPTVIPLVPITIPIFITPEIATAWLCFNVKNRPKKPSVVSRYARDMKSGKWRLTGEPIKFDWNGTLLDGQHRLMAISYSGKGIWSDVRFGLDPNVFVNIDSHIRRGNADFLNIRGEKYARVLVGAVRTVMTLRNGWYGKLDNATFTNEETDEFIDRNPRIRESVEVGSQTKPILTPSLSAGLHFLASEVNKNKANSFWTQLVGGIGLESEDAVRILRERLIANSIVKGKHQKLRTIEVAALIIKAFNYSLKGQKVKALMWKSQGKRPAPFPTFD